MLLRKLRSVSLTNDLSESIESVSILYAEAKGVLPGLAKKVQDKIIDVDVELPKNILWTKTVSLGDTVIPPAETTCASAERICFGDNDGYWQVYFTCSGGDYKLESNKCKMNLVPQCDSNDLEIRLLESAKGGMKAMLKVSSVVSSEFGIVEGKPVEKGVKISIRNQLETAIDHAYVALTEEISSGKGAKPRMQKVNLDHESIESEGVSSSLELVPFNCFGFYHYLSLCFTHEGHCYETVSKREAGNFVKLTHDDYGSTLVVTVSRPASSASGDHLSVKFETNSYKKFRLASKLESTKERRTKIESLVSSVREKDTICDCFLQLETALKRLSEIIGENKAEQKCSGRGSHLVFCRCGDGEGLVKAENLRIPEDMKTRHVSLKADLHYFQDGLENFKETWNDLRESIMPLNRLIETVNPNEDTSIGRIKDDLSMTNSMCLIDTVCYVLLLSGIDEGGLTFFTSSCDSSGEISIRPEALALIIREELHLWKLSVFSRETENQIFPRIEKNNEAALKLMVYSDTFVRLAQLFVLIRGELIQRTMGISLKLRSKNVKVRYSKLTSFGLSAIGGGLTLAGLIAAPFTAGVSLVLVATGVGVGATSGALAVGTTITDGFLTSRYLNSTISLAENSVKLGNALSQLQLMIERQKAPMEDLLANADAANSNSAVGGGESFLQSVDALKTTFAQVGAVFGLFGDDIFVRSGIQMAMTTTLKLGFAVTGLIFDLIFLTLNMVNIGRGDQSELVYKLESDVMSMEQELKDNRLDRFI